MSQSLPHDPPAALSAERIAELVRSTLRTDVDVTADTALLELDGFNSLVLVDLVTRIEEELGRELDLDLITPANVTSCAKLAEVIAVDVPPANPHVG